MRILMPKSRPYASAISSEYSFSRPYLEWGGGLVRDEGGERRERRSPLPALLALIPCPARTHMSWGLAGQASASTSPGLLGSSCFASLYTQALEE